MRRFDETICRNLDLASRREWLETNGIGGFASSTPWMRHCGSSKPCAVAAYTNDYEFVRTRLYAVLADIISWHERGTLLKRWLLGTHQGAVSQEHLDYYSKQRL